MGLDTQQIIRIIELGSSSNARDQNFTTSDVDISADRDLWQQAVAKGNAEKWALWLEWNNLTEPDLEAQLKRRTWSANTQIPDWANFLQTTLNSRHPDPSLEQTPGFIFPNQPLPFEQLLEPFISNAIRVIRSQTSLYDQWFAENVRTIFERYLLSLLIEHSLNAFNEKFVTFRMEQRSSIFWSPTPAELTNDLYRAFVDHWQSQLGVFLEEYAVLARLLSLTCLHWSESVVELLNRIEADIHPLQQALGEDQAEAPTSVIFAVVGLSDAHQSGRRVVALRFNNNLRVVYKPKNLGLEASYYQLLEWFNAHHASPDFYIGRVLEREDYGWVTYVAPLPLVDEQAASRFYQRMGALLCLVYALEGTDCHFENIIAHGEYPVLIDMEALMHYRFGEDPGDTPRNAQTELIRQMRYSVLRTGFLPQWSAHANAEDISAIGHIDAPEILMTQRKWMHINTDYMKPGTVQIRSKPGASSPILEGKPVSPSSYQADIVAGFESFYRFLMEHRTALLADDGPLTRFGSHKIRCIFRDTRIYSTMLQTLQQPKYLKDGFQRSIELDKLSRMYMAFSEKPSIWPIRNFEIAMMENLDVPLFDVRADTPDFMLPDGHVIENCFPNPGYHNMRAHIASLTPQDCQRQVQFIEGTLYAHIAHQQSVQNQSGNNQLSDTAKLLSDQELREEIDAIIEELHRRAFFAEDDSASMISIGFVPIVERYQFQPIGPNLYDGSTGIAVFLSACASIHQDTRARALALALLKPVMLALEDDRSLYQYFDQDVIGGAAGWGGLVYAFTQIAEFLNIPDLHAYAAKAALQITQERIQRDKQLDIIAGASGAILGLLKRYRVTGDPDALKRALWCGEHLLATQQPTPSGGRSWHAVNEPFLTGFSHGAAGNAYALLLLANATGDSRFQTAAQNALEYENAVFSEERLNWPDYRVGTAQEPYYSTAWCHGATGIGLARIGGLSLLDTPLIQRDIQAAVQTTLALKTSDVEQACCGDFGRAELLIKAGDLSGGRQVISAAFEKAKTSAGFQLYSGLPRGAYNPGLFQGMAGIGYECLRLMYPEQIPSFLLWE